MSLIKILRGVIVDNVKIESENSDFLVPKMYSCTFHQNNAIVENVIK
jgi:hypothetical protein